MQTLTLASDIGDLVPIVIPLAGMVFALIVIVIGAVKGHFETRAREQTKREVAAYMAEGSITSEDAERILREPKRKKSGWC
jgi:hypothetical protein